MQIAYLDNHLLAVNKPSGLPSQPDASGDPSLPDLAKAYLKERFTKPGNVYLGLLHRLDRPTSGVVLLARTDKAASRMSEQFRRRQVGKRYLALVDCAAAPRPTAKLVDILVPLENGGMRVLEGEAGQAAAGRQASLSYRTGAMSRDGRRALLEVELETGVKHQIRCQLAHAGLPIVGDFRYGPFGKPARPEPVEQGRAILLHSARLDFVHPVRREATTISAGVPDHWRPFLDQFDHKRIESISAISME